MTLLARTAAGTGFTIRDIQRIASNAPRRYKTFQIKKRNSDRTRTIAQPAKELKHIQRWLVTEELNDLPVHDAAYGYVEGRGIKHNAAVHVMNNFLLKMDFRDFFPSIVPQDLVEHLHQFAEARYNDEEVDLLSRLLFWTPPGERRLQLSIGAPSSPFLSNTMLYRFDLALQPYCSEIGVAYSRYADDMAFSTSTPNILDQVHGHVAQLAGEQEYPAGLAINQAKTVFTSKKHKRFVTGIVLSSENRISLGRLRKREIRAAVHKFSLGRMSAHDAMQLRGLVAFAMDIEPRYVAGLRRTYGDQVISDVLRYKPSGD